ncbi:hypothetical protein BJX65DRAFT_304030 [Aspergillus insuetus]
MVSQTEALSLPWPRIRTEGGIYAAACPLPGSSPSSLLCRLLAKASAGTSAAGLALFSPDIIMDLINTATMVARYAKPPEPYAEATISVLGAEALDRASLSFTPPGTIVKNMNKCCQIAARIFRTILAIANTVTLVQTMPPPILTARTTKTTPGRTGSLFLYDDIELLKATLSKIDFGSWLQHAPEAYVWICFTAAAASVFDESDWTSFILTPMPVLTALDSDELPVLKDSWAYLSWLRDISRGVVHF